MERGRAALKFGIYLNLMAEKRWINLFDLNLMAFIHMPLYSQFIRKYFHFESVNQKKVETEREGERAFSKNTRIYSYSFINFVFIVDW